LTPLVRNRDGSSQ